MWISREVPSSCPRHCSLKNKDPCSWGGPEEKHVAHVGCHEGYTLSSYPDNCSVFDRSMSGMNTQVCEQTRASLETTSTQAKFMSQDHFLQYVGYFLYRPNLVNTQTKLFMANKALAEVLACKMLLCRILSD